MTNMRSLLLGRGPSLQTTVSGVRSKEFNTKLDGKVDNVAWKEAAHHPCHFVCRHGDRQTGKLTFTTVTIFAMPGCAMLVNQSDLS